MDNLINRRQEQTAHGGKEAYSVIMVVSSQLKNATIYQFALIPHFKYSACYE